MEFKINPYVRNKKEIEISSKEGGSIKEDH